MPISHSDIELRSSLNPIQFKRHRRSFPANHSIPHCPQNSSQPMKSRRGVTQTSIHSWALSIKWVVWCFRVFSICPSLPCSFRYVLECVHASGACVSRCGMCGGMWATSCFWLLSTSLRGFTPCVWERECRNGMWPNVSGQHLTDAVSDSLAVIWLSTKCWRSGTDSEVWHLISVSVHPDGGSIRAPCRAVKIFPVKPWINFIYRRS